MGDTLTMGGGLQQLLIQLRLGSTSCCTYNGHQLISPLYFIFVLMFLEGLYQLMQYMGLKFLARSAVTIIDQTPVYCGESKHWPEIFICAAINTPRAGAAVGGSEEQTSLRDKCWQHEAERRQRPTAWGEKDLNEAVSGLARCLLWAFDQCSLHD